MKRILLMLLLLALPLCAAGEELPEPFWGYFEKIVYIRPEPGSDKTAGFVPEQVPVYLTPVDDRYAQVEHQGRSGYVYYVGVKSMPEETPVDAYMAYLPSAKYLFSAPMDRASSLLTLAEGTPLLVTAKVGRFLHVTAQGQEGYVYARDTARISDLKETETSVEFYVEADAEARVYPLKPAEVLFTLEPGRVYTAQAMCNDYYRITVGEKTGYVYSGKITKVRSSGNTVRAAMVTPETRLYTAPDTAFAAEKSLTEEQLLVLEPQQGGFHKVKGQTLYVHVNDVVSYVVEVSSGQRMQILKDTELRKLPQEDAAVVAQLSADQLCLAEYSVEGWYLLQVDGRWGFLKKDAEVAFALRVDAEMMRTAARTVEDAVLYADVGRQIGLPADTPLFITQSCGRFYSCRVEGVSGLIAKTSVELLGNDTELTAYTVAAPAEISVMDFPDAELSDKSFTIPAGESLRVYGFNRCYLMVEYGGRAGYAPQTGLLTAESQGLPVQEDVPRYTLVLDKSTLMAYGFELKEDGSRGELVICAKVGIGKATTPTPSGVFTLGKKERWHRFPRTYTPHTTEYVRARYIHGWPCAGKSEAKVSNYLMVAARVTGGCLRSPFEFARWVYMNCPSYTTEITILSGGFEAPVNAEALLVD